MINQIYRDKISYDLQILMGINYVSLKHIKDQIKCNAKVKICLSYESFRLLLGEFDKNRIRLYVDEFMYSTAFCNNFEQFIENHLDLIKNGYFSSSVKSDHASLLFTLQELNNGKCLTVNEVNKGWL